MTRWMRLLALVLLIAAAGFSPGAAREPEEGVKVGRGSYVRYLYPASIMENSAAQQFVAVKQQASARGALLPPNHPEVARLRKIATDLLPFATKWNARSKDWKWEVVIVKSNNINAFCMPGGKIAFFTGILEQLQLTDDEVAMVMGHEIAHALREHSRARAVKSTITQVGGRVVGHLIFGEAGQAIGAQGAGLLTLKFSRDDESEADLIGMELAARAGYDPASGITLWQKMGRLAKGSPPQWLSTHPASDSRVKLIQDNLKDVKGLYERARAAKAAGLPVPPPTAAAPAPAPTPAKK